MAEGKSGNDIRRINARIPLRLYRKLMWSVSQNESSISVELKKLIKQLPDPPNDWEPDTD